MHTIDFHSHILPRADHGSDGAETTQKQLDRLAGAGVDTVIATPHFYPNRHNVDEFIKRRDRSFAELSALNTNGLTVLTGAELLVCRNLDQMEGLGRLCINNTNTLLLEMPLTDSWDSSLIDSVEAIADAGYVPIMAHIDRYSARQADTLAELGVQLQLNAACLGKLFSKRRFIAMAENGLVSAIGSDLHGTDPKSARAYQKSRAILGDSLFFEIMKKSERLAGLA